MLGIFVAQPWLALVPSAVFFTLYRISGRRLSAAAAIVWTLYAFYEYGMQRRWMCSGECNIRVDLILLYPILAIVSLTAAIVAIVAVVRRRRVGP